MIPPLKTDSLRAGEHKAPKMPEISDEAWIDFESLTTSGFIDHDNLMTFYFEYDEDEKYDQTIKFKMRLAVRAVGHKITRMEKRFNKNGDLYIIYFKTTITVDEATRAMKLYNDWLGEVEECEYDDSDDETVVDSQSEDTDPITC